MMYFAVNRRRSVDLDPRKEKASGAVDLTASTALDAIPPGAARAECHFPFISSHIWHPAF